MGNPTLITAMLGRMDESQLREILAAVQSEMADRGLADAGEILASVGGDSFVDLVAEMMAAQQVYFRANHGTIVKSNALKESMALESKVRKAIADGAARRQSKMEL